MPVLPLPPHDKIDIVPANSVGKPIVTIHQKEAPAHDIYHLSSGTGSQTSQELTDAISQAGGMMRPMYLPSLGGPFSSTVNWGAKRSGAAGDGGSLLKGFRPYRDWNARSDNWRFLAYIRVTPSKSWAYAGPRLD